MIVNETPPLQVYTRGVR